MKFNINILVSLIFALLSKATSFETEEYKTEALKSSFDLEMSKSRSSKNKFHSESKSNIKSPHGKVRVISAKKEKDTPLNMNLNLPDADVYYQGWARYYHYDIMSKPNRIKKPKLFFQNDRYFNQRIRRPEHKRADKYGSLAIPNKAAFFMILYNKTLSVFSSREDTLRRQVDMVSLNYLLPIPEDDLNKGSVRDLGEFPTGSCLEVSAKIPLRMGGEKILNYWIICFDKQKDKQIFKKVLIKLKIRIQRDDGMIPFTVDQQKIKNNLGSKFRLPKEEIKPENKSPLNGYWMLLQDWTDCTLSCGGGWHYQQWMCVPPKFGGIDCIGDPIRRRPCNTQPCPDPQEILNKKNSIAHLPVVSRPTVHVGRFSARPQRYSKCLIKENDAFLTEFDKLNKVKKKVPVRVLMNNRTISIFQDDDYSDMMYTYKLSNTNFLHSEKFCCFGLRDNEKESHVCGYPENCGDEQEKNIWANKWKDDYNLFKVLCKTGIQETMLNADDLDRLNSTELQDPLGIDVEAVRRRRKHLKDEMIAEKGEVFKKNIIQTQELGFRAIEREFSIENMIKKEEKAKEDADLLDIEEKIKKEEKKANCVKKSIEEKDLDDDWDEKVEAEEEMDRLKKKINLKVEEGRNRVKKLLAEMRKKAKIRKAALEQRLQAVRAKMAADIMLENKEGTIPPCLKGKVEPDFRETYCNAAFVEDYINNSSCKSAEDFCYTCCEHEFGNAFRMKRSTCYKACDDADKKASLVGQGGEGDDGKKKSGEWTWAPEQKVKTS